MALLATSCVTETEALDADEAADRLVIESTRVFAGDGSVIASLHGEVDREIVPLDRIPEHVRNAIIAVEDGRFWDHPGIDARSIVRATFANVRSVLGDTGVQGGSTISQQLAKNLYFPTPARSIDRKVAEARVALELEREHSKERILEMYLNTIYLGRGVYGVQSAARSYFQKNVEELSAGEAAYLAGLIHDPARYDFAEPDDPERQQVRHAAAVERRNYALRRMYDLGMITAEERYTHSAQELAAHPRRLVRWQHPYFVDLVMRQLGVLRSPWGLDERFAFLGDTFSERARTVYEGGLRIFTTLDPRFQEATERAISDSLPDMDRLSASGVVIHPQTGHIKALVGGRDYYPSGCSDPEIAQTHTCRVAKLNLALGNEGGGSGRQPGSAFKTVVLAAALEQGIALNSSWNSSQFTQRLTTGEWRVHNYTRSSSGNVTMLAATERSINAAYARILIDGLGGGDPLAGSAKSADIARRLGAPFPTVEEVRERCGDRFGHGGACTPADVVPAVSLGAVEVSPLTLAQIYATLANDGVRVEPTAIYRIEDSSGNVLYEAEPESERAVSPEVARGVTYALHRALENGTGTRARIGRPAAGKTGTSQSWRDAWFAGYTPEIAAVFWVGNPLLVERPDGSSIVESMQPSSGYPIRVVGGSYPAMMWGRMMREAMDGIPASAFLAVPRHLLSSQRSPLSEAAERARRLSDIRLPEHSFSEPRPSRPESRPAAEQGAGSQRETGPAPATARGGSGGGNVPSVVGQSLAQAYNTLQRAGYRGAGVRECAPGGGSANRVWRQSPGAGSSAPAGSTVTVWYSPAVC